MTGEPRPRGGSPRGITTTVVYRPVTKARQVEIYKRLLLAHPEGETDEVPLRPVA